MKLGIEQLDDLASILHAFEDPDSEVPFLEENSEEFNEELQAYKQLYETLNINRIKGLRGAVGLLLTQEIKDLKHLENLVPDFYRQIWTHLEDTEATEEIIKELDRERYVKAMFYILKQATQYHSQ